MPGFGPIGSAPIGGLPDDDYEFFGKSASIALEGIVTAGDKTSEGVLIRATSQVWQDIVKWLGHDWSKAYSIPPDKWEEIVAGAYDKAGFNEVTLTPRSGDHGRDVIAVKHGVGSIRVLGSVKAYRPGHLITKEQVHAFMGVVAIDPNASKGIITTTSDFAPRLLDDVRLKNSVPHRLELMNGQQLSQWLREINKK